MQPKQHQAIRQWQENSAAQKRLHPRLQRDTLTPGSRLLPQHHNPVEAQFADGQFVGRSPGLYQLDEDAAAPTVVRLATAAPLVAASPHEEACEGYKRRHERN